MILLILFLIVLILCSAFISGSETALFSLSLMKVRVFKQDPDPRKRLVAQLLAKPRTLLVTVLIINIVLNILIQNVVSSIFGTFAKWILSVGVPLGLTLVFGEVIPKSIALGNNARISYHVAPVIRGAEIVFYPVRKVLLAITNVVSRVTFFFLKREGEISGDQLQHALKASREYGVLGKEEAELVSGYLDLQESTAKEHLRPRDEMLCYDIEDPLSILIELFVEREVTRVPVYERELNEMLGVLPAHVFFLHQNEITEPSQIRPLLEKPYYVPESTSAYTLLHEMYEKEETIALVVDEYGTISGLITLEDLVEVVVGEIADRRDNKSLYTRSGDDVIIASGKLELIDFEEHFGIPLESKEGMVTLGGWLTEQLGDIPKSGAKFTTKDFLFQVLAADPTRVRRIYVRRRK